MTHEAGPPSYRHCAYRHCEERSDTAIQGPQAPGDDPRGPWIAAPQAARDGASAKGNLAKAAAITLALACIALPAGAATLRPFTTLSGAVVRLSDLFDAAGLDRALGPAPAPGSRITVEAAQLGAIARQFGVDWRPAGPADRAVLDRPGRTLGRDDVLAPLRAALAGSGVPRDADLEMPGFTTPMLPVDATPALDVTQLEYDGGTGRFTALLSVSADGVPMTQLRLSGRVQEMVELPVPRRRMLPGDVVLADDLQWTRLRATLARGEVVRTTAEAVGQALRRPVQPGQPILLADLGRPVLVTKGMPMLLALDGPGIQLTATGVATEPAGLGERVRVLNPASRVVVEAEVTGPGRARVMPGSQPVPAPNRMAAR
jgi:flagella basal body P-ring formation protein FlgA